MDKQYLEKQIRQNIWGTGSAERDFLPLYADRVNFDLIAQYLAEPYRGLVDFVAAPESLGYILGSKLAGELGVGFAAIRGADHYHILEDKLLSASYIDHYDRVRSVVMRRDLIPAHSRVLLVDDWIGTGVTMQACLTLLEEAEAYPAGIAALGMDKCVADKGIIPGSMVHCVYLRG
ncbi:MAG: phosphoribosyltransferase family protein [Lachnospiraceae bacterium]|jgi:adenine phosphoribosyltransferase